MSRYKIIQSLAWLLALVMLAVVLSRLPISSILHTISGMSTVQWLVWTIINMLIIALYGMRWFILIQPLNLSVSYVQLLLIRQAGQAISFITPGPQFGGEPLQVFWLWRNFSSPGHSAFLAVALDRFYELWINFAVLLLGIVLLLGTPNQDFADWKSIGAALGFIILILSFIGWILLRQRSRVSDWIRKLALRWERSTYLNDLDTHWNSLSRQLEEVVIKNKKTLVHALIISIVGWAGMLMEIGFLLSFLDTMLSFSDFVYLMVAMRLAFLLPLPGGIGTLEAAVFWVFLSLGLPATAAIGLIALMRLRDAIILIASLASVRVLQMKCKIS